MKLTKLIYHTSVVFATNVFCIESNFHSIRNNMCDDYLYPYPEIGDSSFNVHYEPNVQLIWKARARCGISIALL